MPDWQKLRPEGGFTFTEKGDAVEGTITALEEVPTLGETARLSLKVVVRTATAAEVVFYTPSNLLALFCDRQPDVGDWIRAELVGFKHTGKPQPLKLFELDVRREEKAATATASQPAADDL